MWLCIIEKLSVGGWRLVYSQAYRSWADAVFAAKNYEDLVASPFQRVRVVEGE